MFYHEEDYIKPNAARYKLLKEKPPVPYFIYVKMFSDRNKDYFKTRKIALQSKPNLPIERSNTPKIG